VRLPDEVPVFVLRGGRAEGRALPAIEPGASLAAWRAVVTGGPFLVRTEATGASRLALVRRLATVGEVWLDADAGSVGEALDLLVAGASRLRVHPGDADLVYAVGPSCLLVWTGEDAWDAVQALALEQASPVLAEAEVPPGAACDAFRFEAGRLVRIASAPATEDGEDGEEGE
jgi:hypothetical protein